MTEAEIRALEAQVKRLEALLWPGHYGPFTACWLNGGWSICEDSDLRHATVGAEIALPHLVTDAIPFAEM